MIGQLLSSVWLLQSCSRALRHSDMDLSFTCKCHQCLPLPRKRSPDVDSPDWGCGIAAYYSFIHPQKMKGWVGHLWNICWPWHRCWPLLFQMSEIRNYQTSSVTICNKSCQTAYIVTVVEAWLFLCCRLGCTKIYRWMNVQRYLRLYTFHLYVCQHVGFEPYCSFSFTYMKVIMKLWKI